MNTNSLYNIHTISAYTTALKLYSKFVIGSKVSTQIFIYAQLTSYIEPRLDKNPFGNGFGPPGGPPGLNPMAAQFMALQHPAFLGQVSAAGLPAPFGLPSPASVVTSSPSIPGRPEPQFMKGPNAASLASLEALQR